MIKLEKGAKVRVRLHTGEVVEAVYDEPAKFTDVHRKSHWVEVNGKLRIAIRSQMDSLECRFVGPACVLGPVGVSDD